jgi:hypothetical protein
MPVAHGNEGLRGEASRGERDLKRLGLRSRQGQKRRGTADLCIDLPRDQRSTLRDQFRQRPAQQSWQAEDGGIGEEVGEERLDR